MIGRWLVLLAVLACGACAHDPIVTYYQTVATTAIGAATCREVLHDAHEMKMKAVIAQAVTDKASAQVNFDRWMPMFEKGRTTCKAMKLGAKLGLDAGPSVQAAVDRDKQVAAWIARLLKLGLDASQALAEAGIKLPGGL